MNTDVEKMVHLEAERGNMPAGTSLREAEMLLAVPLCACALRVEAASRRFMVVFNHHSRGKSAMSRLGVIPLSVDRIYIGEHARGSRAIVV